MYKTVEVIWFRANGAYRWNVALTVVSIYRVNCNIIKMFVVVNGDLFPDYFPISLPHMPTVTYASGRTSWSSTEHLVFFVRTTKERLGSHLRCREEPMLSALAQHHEPCGTFVAHGSPSQNPWVALP